MATCVWANLFNLNVCLNPGPNARLLCYVESLPTRMTSILGSRGTQSVGTEGVRDFRYRVAMWLSSKKGNKANCYVS